MNLRQAVLLRRVMYSRLLSESVLRREGKDIPIIIFSSSVCSEALELDISRLKIGVELLNLILSLIFGFDEVQVSHAGIIISE